MPQIASEQIQSEIQKLAPSAVIQLFVLEISGEPEPLYFHNGTNQLHESVIWQGKKYIPLPVEIESFDVSSNGELPRPKIAIANVKGVFSSLIRQYDDLIGAKLIRKRTFARYLDAENFKDGNPTADPNVSFPDDIWYIDKKDQETKLLIQWELASAFDLQGVQLPRRQIIQNYCQWKYRGGECGYDGPYFDLNDLPCGTKEQDVCSKKLSACKARFNSIRENEKIPLPFGGFPGASRNNG